MITAPEKYLFLAYGMAIMFYSVMAWLFCFRSKGRAKRIIAVLMATVAIQYVKDLFLIDDFYGISGNATSEIATCLDIATVPIYGYVLAELCRPGWLSNKLMACGEIPFVVLAGLYLLTLRNVFFYSLVVLSLIFGLMCGCWVVSELPKYHKRLKSEYSYDENINLHWMRGVTVTFFFVLLSWIISCIYTSLWNDFANIIFSLAAWMVVCYFMYKQELVIKDVVDSTHAIAMEESLGRENVRSVSSEMIVGDLGVRLEKLFSDEKSYLNPRLRLTDLAQKLGTNRTYLSNYFNQHCSQSFYEYVNNYRVAHAEQLLLTTDYTLDVVAERSGFNSLSTFRRAFAARHGCSPQAFRAK